MIDWWHSEYVEENVVCMFAYQAQVIKKIYKRKWSTLKLNKVSLIVLEINSFTLVNMDNNKILWLTKPQCDLINEMEGMDYGQR